MRRRRASISKQPRDGNGHEPRDRQSQHADGPTRSADHELSEGSEQELAHRSAGVDQPGCERTAVRRQILRRDPDQDCKASRGTAGRNQHAQRQDQSQLGGAARGKRRARGEQQPADDEHAIRTIVIRDRTEQRLRRTPDQLADGERETDGSNADTGGSDDGIDEQPHGLPHPHGDEKNPRGGQEHRRRSRCGRPFDRAGRKAHASRPRRLRRAALRNSSESSLP